MKKLTSLSLLCVMIMAGCSMFGKKPATETGAVVDAKTKTVTETGSITESGVIAETGSITESGSTAAKTDATPGTKIPRTDVSTKTATPDPKDLLVYINTTFNYELYYDSTFMTLNEENTTDESPVFKLTNEKFITVTTNDNSDNLTAKAWLDKEYADYSGGWSWDFAETTIGDYKAYEAIRNETGFYIHKILIPVEDKIYMFDFDGSGLPIEDQADSVEMMRFMANTLMFVVPDNSAN